MLTTENSPVKGPLLDHKSSEVNGGVHTPLGNGCSAEWCLFLTEISS